MKKASVILLTVFYALLATDMSVVIHKCMGSVQNISVMQEAETCCCGDLNEDSCCENETLDLPEEADHETFSSYQFCFEKSPIGTIELPGEELLEKLVILDYEFVYHDLPPPKSEPVYLLHGRLTYYG